MTNESQAPTVGRIVHYYPPDNGLYGPGPFAALVVAVNGLADLVVFLPNGEIRPVGGILHARNPEPDTWCWPPRVG